MTMKSSPYEIIANAFTAMDIANSLCKFDIADDEETISQNWLVGDVNHDLEFCLLLDESKKYYYLSFDARHYDINNAELITSDMIIAANLSLLKLVTLFKARNFFFLLNDDIVSHVVYFQDLDKLPMKLYLFSLFLEVESKIMDKLERYRFPFEPYFLHLSIKRLEKVEETYRKKYGLTSHGLMQQDKLLLCTNFSDKTKMLLKLPDIDIGKFGFKSKHQAKSFFNLVERVRNRIAHSDSIIIDLLDTPEKFSAFVSDLQNCLKAISEIW